MRGQTGDNSDAVILGGGRPRLTTGYLPSQARRCTLIERESGLRGLTRTIEIRGFRFDLGGQRTIVLDAKLDAFLRDILRVTIWRWVVRAASCAAKIGSIIQCRV